MSLLDVVFTELISVCWRFILSISTTDVAVLEMLITSLRIYIREEKPAKLARPRDVRPRVASKQLTSSSKYRLLRKLKVK